jgi:hypothetical protein
MTGMQSEEALSVRTLHTTIFKDKLFLIFIARLFNPLSYRKRRIRPLKWEELPTCV